jgi:hypothetical protein
MKGHPRRLLDRTGDALLPDGFTLIQSEKDFLLHAFDNVKMLIRGETVCRWAESFFRARNLPFEIAVSPTKALRNACPELSVEQAGALFNALGNHYQELGHPIKLIDVLEALYPTGPWQAIPTRLHTATWILWLWHNKLPDYTYPLLKSQATQWRTSCADEDSYFYDVHTLVEAEKLLRVWLGIADRPRHPTLGLFPCEVPANWQQMTRLEWASQILSKGWDLFDEIRSIKLPPELHNIAASVTFDFYKANPALLTQKRVNILSGYLTSKDALRLQNLCPPSDPGELPVSPTEVFQWFKMRYLPYRKWQVDFGDSAADQRIIELAASFAQWCLDIYPAALSGAKDFLAISNASSLQKSRHDCVTLWAILDGLHCADAKTLCQLIEPDSRLTMEIESVTLSPLPTITHFCKKSVLYGQPPAMVETKSLNPDFPGAISLPENKDPIPILRKAKEGDIFVWRIEEPDKTYHKPFERKILLAKVESQLKYIADQINLAARAVPNEHTLRVVISTDHGRLLSASKRTHSVPTDMETHGRAAYGNSGIPFDASGYLVKEAEQIVYLHRTRFQLPVDCAVALDANSFVMNDGKTGTEEFSHGGLYPEEVLVPWMQFARDWKPPIVQCRVSGKAVAGKTGELRIHFENPGKVPIFAAELNINLGNQEIRQVPIDITLTPMSSTDNHVSIENWPSKAQCERASGYIVFQMPNQKGFQCPATFVMASEQMYAQDTDASVLLKELGDL